MGVERARFFAFFFSKKEVYPEGKAGGLGIEFPPIFIGEESPVSKKYAPIPAPIKIKIIKIQIQAEPLLFFIIFIFYIYLW